MSDHLPRHDLLLYVDGELSRQRTRRAKQHLLSCWSCRRDLERLEQDIGAIVDAQNRSFLPSLPPPAKPWRSLEELAETVPGNARRSELLRHVGERFAHACGWPLRWGLAF